MADKYDLILKKIYFDPKSPGSLGGMTALFREANKFNREITMDHVKRFLTKERTYTLHKPIRKRFARNRTLVGSIDKQWQVDLADMTKLGRANGGYRYLLTCIDCFSRYAWVVPVKRKNAEDMEAAFRKLLQMTHPRKPERLQSDKGKEFFNSRVRNFLAGNNIHHFASDSDFKAAIVERFNRTLKNKIWHHFTANNTNRFLEVLPHIVNSYNHSFHRSIGMAPAQVKKKDELKIWQMMNVKPDTKDPIESGETVRISKAKTIFDKGYLPNWTEELFRVKGKVQHPRKVYKLEDLANENVKGSYYKHDIQSVPEDPTYLIEKKIRKRKVGDRTEYLVKWQGWPSKFNSWLDEKDILNYGGEP